MATKWQVLSDEHGNMYFYNTLTGESVWELPEEPDDDEDQQLQEGDATTKSNGAPGTGDPRLSKRKEHYSDYEVAIGVVDALVQTLEAVEQEGESGSSAAKTRRKFVSPAAEARHARNVAIAAKRRQRNRDRAFKAYLELLVPSATHSSAETGAQTSTKARGVGSLFTAADAANWQRERERERNQRRRALRRARSQHRERVVALQQQQELLIAFRAQLMRHLLGQIHCSSELQKQRILVLTTPQSLAQMLEHAREMKTRVEPEIAEKVEAEQRLARRQYEENIQEVFAAVDKAGAGKVHLLQILFSIFSMEQPQQLAAKVRGLGELLGSVELQRFLIDFVSQVDATAGGSRAITVDEFHEFVAIIEEVLDHYAGVKAAVEDAENDIDTMLAAVATTPGMSVARARMGIMSEKKLKHEMTVLQEAEAQLQAMRDRERRREFRSEEGSFVAPKEEWEKNHHHRLIRLEQHLPLYCCLCRRRKWELWRREHEECESDYRGRWPTMHALMLKNEELRTAQEKARVSEDAYNQEAPEKTSSVQQTAAKQSQSESENQPAKYEGLASLEHWNAKETAVRDTVKALVMLVESTMSLASSQSQDKSQRRTHKKLVRKAPAKKDKPGKDEHGGATAAFEVPERVKLFENEEQERKHMYTEELHMAMLLERNRRSVERPFLRAQDAAYNAYVRLIEHCVNPTGFLSRLQFKHCLSFEPPQKLTMEVRDEAESLPAVPRCFVLRTVPCRTEHSAEFIFRHTRTMKQTLRSPFVAEVSSVGKHMFQLFSELGLLVECWPVVFVVSEHFSRGPWLDLYRERYLSPSGLSMGYAATEQHLVSVFREVAAGLTAMHSLGLMHLNLNLGNIYIAGQHGAKEHELHVKIGGLLSWKHGFDDAVRRGVGCDMLECFNYNYAPPEVVKEQQATAKADAWMLGCSLCEALLMWQHQQLIASAPNPPAQSTPPLIFHSKSTQELLQGLPIFTSAAVRSLIRMLLQPNPVQRPQMSQVVDLLSLYSRPSGINTVT